MQSKIKFLSALAFLTLFVSCLDDEMTDVEPVIEVPFQELYEQGVDRYLGKWLIAAHLYTATSGVVK